MASIRADGSGVVSTRPECFVASAAYGSVRTSRLHIAPILKARLQKVPFDIDNPSWVEDDQFDIDRQPEYSSPAARAKGAERYDRFVEALGRRLSSGASVLKEIALDMHVRVD